MYCFLNSRYGQTAQLSHNYQMQSPTSSARIQPYPVQGGRMQYTSSSAPQNAVVNNNAHNAESLNSSPADQPSTLQTSPVSSCSTSSPNGTSSRNAPVSPSCNNTSLTSLTGSSNSTSPSCEHSYTAGNEPHPTPSDEKTTYHTMAQITPLNVLSTEYPIPPLTPFAINQCYDVLDDYFPASVYSVL